MNYLLDKIFFYCLINPFIINFRSNSINFECFLNFILKKFKTIFKVDLIKNKNFIEYRDKIKLNFLNLELSLINLSKVFHCSKINFDESFSWS